MMLSVHTLKTQKSRPGATAARTTPEPAPAPSALPARAPFIQDGFERKSAPAAEAAEKTREKLFSLYPEYSGYFSRAAPRVAFTKHRSHQLTHFIEKQVKANPTVKASLA